MSFIFFKQSVPLYLINFLNVKMLICYNGLPILFTAPLLDGWNVTVLNVSHSSVTFQWPKLTDVHGNQVRGYVPIAEATGGKEIAGDIVPPTVTSITIGGLDGGTEYRLFAAVVDVLGQPHRSSEVLMFTDEGSELKVKLYEITTLLHSHWAMGVLRAH